MKTLSLMSLGLAALLTSAATLAADNTGKLYQERCTSCHGDSVYTRPNRKVDSLDALSGQISACGHGSGKPLTAEERNAMVRYLNEKYYRFK